MHLESQRVHNVGMEDLLTAINALHNDQYSVCRNMSFAYSKPMTDTGRLLVDEERAIAD